jgi:hypothetical protein
MAQLVKGTVTVTSGQARVIGDATTDWTDAQTALTAGTPVYFSLIGQAYVPIQVQAFTTPGTSASGFWECTLVTQWIFATTVGASYMLHKDFTPNWDLPIFSPGDSQTAQMLSRMVTILDSFGYQLTGGNYTAKTTSNDVVVPDGQSLVLIEKFLLPSGVSVRLGVNTAMRLI